MNLRATKQAITALALLLAGASETSAHVTLETPEAKVGGGYKAVFKVPHGCDGSATVEIKIDIPEGVIAVKPMPKPGWTIELQKGAYARGYAFYHGKTLTEGVRQVTWRGGPLSDAYFDEFVLSTFIAGELQPGSRLAFPVTQRCEAGEIAWVEVAKDGENAHALKSPAPQLALTAGKTDEHAHHGEAVRAGDLVIESPWTRATPAGATAAAGYFKIINTGDAPDVLIGATTDVAERAELHETAINADGVATMRPLPDGLSIKPGEVVELKPLGRHLMLMGLKAPLSEGQSVTVKLHFKRAGSVTIPLQVKAIGASGMHVH